MKKDFTRLFIAVSAFFLLGLVIFLINQTAQLVSSAQALHPTFGRLTLFALLLFYALVIAVPVFLFIRLPKSLLPPDPDDEARCRDYRNHLLKRLVANPHLSGTGRSLASTADLESALAELGRQAQSLIAATAKTVFVSTAVSQNGRLDGLLVLAAQTRLVWQIAHLYQQRPSLKDLAYLYTNIAAAVFLVSELDDLDLAEQLEPIAAAVLGGSVTGAVPGLGVVTQVITNSLIDGAASAFLTLRVGIIARNYCGALSLPDRRATRKKATTEAAALLGAVIYASSKQVSLAMWTAAKKAGGSAAKQTGRKIAGRTKALWAAALSREASKKSPADPP